MLFLRLTALYHSFAKRHCNMATFLICCGEFGGIMTTEILNGKASAMFPEPSLMSSYEMFTVFDRPVSLLYFP